MRWFLIICILFCVLSTSSAQKKSHITLPYQSSISSKHKSNIAQRRDVIELFKLIEKEICSNTISGISQHLGNTIYITITTYESDYFSKNQAVAILANFFSNHKFVSFSFSRIDDRTAMPYATGRYIYITKGSQESCQIYVSLTLQKSTWVITQFNIY